MKKLKYLFLLFFFFAISQHVFSQNIDSLKIKNQVKSYFPKLADNTFIQAKAPFVWQKKEWLLFGGIAATTYGLTFLDPIIDKSLKDFGNTPGKKQVSKHISELGKLYGLGGLALFCGINLLANNQKGVQTSVLASQSIFTSLIWVSVLKFGTGRERPFYVHQQNETISKWYGPKKIGQKAFGKYVYDSFPSGHTAIAFSLATTFAHQYPQIKWVAPVSYSLACLVGISRITENKHWATDVIVSSLIGYFCSRQIYLNRGKKTASINSKRENSSKSISSSISPYFA
jgi:membrane-associated phospholipid phosphatase